MQLSVASDALQLWEEGSAHPIRFISAGEAASPTLRWQPLGALLPQTTCRLSFHPLLDRLGQSVQIDDQMFTVTGSSGITLFGDAAFTRPISGLYIRQPAVWVEVSASSAAAIDRAVYLRTQPAVSASGPLWLALHRADIGGNRFRGKLSFQASRSIPEHVVPLVPGEKVLFTSTLLTSDRKEYHYLTAGNTPPSDIRRIRVFTDEHYVREAAGDFPQDEVDIEIEAIDANWVFRDSSPLRLFSNSDSTGIQISLLESGLHTGRFRGKVSLHP